MRKLMTSVAMVLVAGGLGAEEKSPNPEMVMETSEGVIVIELFEEKAPITVANIIEYAEKGHYDGTIFHRVIPGFMIQTGGYSQDMVRRQVGEGIRNESKNGLKNDRGTVALALPPRDPHGGTAQFFINLINNDFLDYPTRNPGGWGYAVFGRVTDGMTVVDRISRTRTRALPNGQKDVPTIPIIVEKVTIRRSAAEEASSS